MKKGNKIQNEKETFFITQQKLYSLFYFSLYSSTYYFFSFCHFPHTPDIFKFHSQLWKFWYISFAHYFSSFGFDHFLISKSDFHDEFNFFIQFILFMCTIISSKFSVFRLLSVYEYSSGIFFYTYAIISLNSIYSSAYYSFSNSITFLFNF